MPKTPDLKAALDNRRATVHGMQCDHACEACKEAAHAIISCQNGDHAKAAEHLIDAALHCEHCCGE